MADAEPIAARGGERGAALLTVLMLVAVIAVMAGAGLERLRLSTRLAGNAGATEQAHGYALAAEALALAKVTDLLGRNPGRVTLAGDWSGRPFGLPLPGGAAVARVVDGGNCFNLNGLVSRSAPGVYVDNPLARLQFARLMRLLDIPAQTAEAVASGAADWIDTDQDQQAMGAEDAAYLAHDTPFRTAGTLMADPSELRAVAGVTPDIYARLRPWLCALPKAEPSRINVNTLLPEQAPLFAMLLPDTLSVAGASQMLLRRPPAGYADASAFWQGPALAAITPGPDAQGQTATTTTWFRLSIEVTLGTTNLHEDALIDASRLPARLVARQWNADS